MKNFLCLFPFFFLFLLFPPVSIAQLSASESKIMLQVQEFLEYPLVFQGWNNWTNFCYLPWSTSVVIVCSENHITEITVIGNKTSPSQFPNPTSANSAISQQTLSSKFSIDALFTTLTKLSNLKVLSLVSLGLWGPLPAKIIRFSSLEVLNMSSNFIYGSIPASLASLKNLRSLVLADNLLNGTVPDLRSLQVLEELDLGRNQLGPNFPTLGNTLVSIILKNNSFRSHIPLDFINFAELQRFDVSSNKLVGPIPSSLFALPSIQYLSLAKNQFSGALSANISCSAKLGFVDVSENLLIGMLPSCIGSNSPNRTVLSSWNCLSNGSSKYQHPYSFCHKEALAVKPPSRSDQQQQQPSRKLGLILGIIGGVIGAAGVSGLLIFLILKKAGRNQAKNYKCDSFVLEKGSFRSTPGINGRHVPRTKRMASLGIPPYHVFTLEEMEDATNNFDAMNLVGGLGSQGQLYKGWLRDGSVVLVKCLKLKQKHSPLSLQHQIEVISKLRHRHLVSVLGHCTVTYQDHPNTACTVFIVLEYVTNGSLRDHLTDWRKREVLKWPQRMGITIGIARGIQFLHTGIVPGIFGNDLKIENILLDDNLIAKISGYNMTLTSVGPEIPLGKQDACSLLDRAEDAEKDDIYELGAILLEVITGKPITSDAELDDLKLELEKGLVEGPSTLGGVTDPSIRGTFAYDSLKTMVQITVNCLCRDSTNRPSIEDVLWHMQYSIQVQEGWTSSGSLSTKF